MLNRIAPYRQRLRHLHRPAAFRAHVSDDGAGLTLGQRLAERAAGGLGSWRFIGIQAGVMALWVLLNTVIVLFRWDAYPFVFLNLAMSAEAAFTGPVLLIAANVGAMRDHAQAARMELLEAKIATRLDLMEQRMLATGAPPPELAPRDTTTARKATTARAPKVSAARKA